MFERIISISAFLRCNLKRNPSIYHYSYSFILAMPSGLTHKVPHGWISPFHNYETLATFAIYSNFILTENTRESN